MYVKGGLWGTFFFVSKSACFVIFFTGVGFGNNCKKLPRTGIGFGYNCKKFPSTGVSSVNKLSTIPPKKLSPVNSIPNIRFHYTWQPFWQNLGVSTYHKVLAFFQKILSLSRKCSSITFAKISDVFGFDRRKVKKSKSQSTKIYFILKNKKDVNIFKDVNIYCWFLCPHLLITSFQLRFLVNYECQ